MNFLKTLESWRNTVQHKVGKLTSQVPEANNMVIQVRPGLCHMPFPQPHLMHTLAQFVTKRFGSNFFIWNLGEQVYDSDCFLNQVSHTRILNYPVFPLADLLLIAVNIKQWLKQEGNVALVHCGKNKGRSALLLAVYLYLDGWHPFLEDALVEMNRTLSINKNQSLFPSQHVFIRNCINLFQGFKINDKPLRLIRIIMSKTPLLVDSQDTQNPRFHPSVAIYHLNTHLATVDQWEMSGSSLCIDLSLEMMDDILVWVKHKDGEDLYSCFRVILNTNFVSNHLFRVNQNQLDITKNVKPCKDFFIDFMFESVESSQRSRLSEVWEEVQKAFKLHQQPKPIKTLERELVHEKLREIYSASSQNAQQTSFSIDDTVGPVATIQKMVPNVIERLVMQGICAQESEDVDDYIKKLEESIDMS